MPSEGLSGESSDVPRGMPYDPAFPDRPRHPDFARLVEVVTRVDDLVDRGERDPLAIAAEVVDGDSVTYMAVQRARRLSLATGLPVPALAAIFLDGFVAGAGFERAGGQTLVEGE